MAQDHSSIVKRSRRLGVVLGKEKYARRRAYPPGIHGPKQARSRARLSSYGEQLQEKQKAKALYGLLERQMHRYFEQASRKQGNTAEAFVQLLERRLDNTVYRLGFAKTRPQARQMVGHGFILVNGKKVDIPSFKVSVGDEITLKENKKQKGIVKQIPEALQSSKLPSWISRDEKILLGKVTAIPTGEDLESIFDPTLIVEFYSR
ncbi:30S ribosomal protein S4 [Candidatus Uhrbacteria bacterium]|nr:30S ribosomal protein S4 [Candidatus Uhrbacteria bacterium]